MTRRLPRRREARDGHLEVHDDEGKDHRHHGHAEHVHDERLIDFLERFPR